MLVKFGSDRPLLPWWRKFAIFNTKSAITYLVQEVDYADLCRLSSAHLSYPATVVLTRCFKLLIHCKIVWDGVRRLAYDIRLSLVGSEMCIRDSFVTMATGVGVIQILFAELISPTTKTLCFAQELGTYLLCKKSYSNFFAVKKSVNFCYHGNRGRLSKVWLTPFNWPILKTPYSVQASGPYLLHKVSYSQFCVENRKFSSPWQHGLSEPNLTRIV